MSVTTSTPVGNPGQSTGPTPSPLQLTSTTQEVIVTTKATPKDNTSTPPSSITATTTAAPIIVKGHMTMMVSSPSEFMSDVQAQEGIATAIASATSSGVDNIQLKFSSEGRRLQSTRVLNSEASRPIRADYTITVPEDVDRANPYIVASSIMSKSLSEWSSIFTTAADSSSWGGAAYTIDVTSVSSPTVGKLSTEWNTGPWQPCSASCGQGVQVRSVTCASSTSDAAIAICNRSNKPVSSRPCVLQACSYTRSHVVDVELSIVAQSTEHSEVLSSRLASTEHFETLEDWLNLWLIQKFGAQMIRSTPEAAGELLQWCAGPAIASDAASPEAAEVFRSMNENPVRGRLTLHVEDASEFATNPGFGDALESSIAALAQVPVGDVKVVVQASAAARGADNRPGSQSLPKACGSKDLVTAYFTIAAPDGFGSASKRASAVRSTDLAGATAAVRSELSSRGESHLAQVIALSAWTLQETPQELPPDADNSDGSGIINLVIAFIGLISLVLILVAIGVKCRILLCFPSRRPASKKPVISAWGERESSPGQAPQECKFAESRSNSARSSSSSLSSPALARCPALGHIFSSWGKKNTTKVHPASIGKSSRSSGAEQPEVCDIPPLSLSSHWRDGLNWSMKLPNLVKSPRLVPVPPERQLSELS